MNDLDTILTCIGLGLITVFTRSFFFLSRRELELPTWIQRGLRYAPLAALAAVIAPELLLIQGEFIQTWKHPQIFGAAAGLVYFFLRGGLLGTIVTGMLVFSCLRLAWQ